MRSKQLPVSLSRSVIILAVLLVLVCAADGAVKFRVLHAFQCGNDGCGSYAGVTVGPSGNLYGAPLGGANNAGIIIKLTPVAGGRHWNYQILHTLTYSEGGVPFAGVSLDVTGNIYGMASAGGTHSGTVFELSPSSTSWNATVLYNFCSEGGGYCTDGTDPYDGPILDAAGNIYATTRDGGANGGGVAFESSPGSSGWTENVLYSFCPQNDCSGGSSPWAGLIFDHAGNLYGMNQGGGSPACSGGCGTVFELSPGSGGTWNETVLYSFDAHTGYSPYAGLVFDRSGNLYGAAFYGDFHGTVFKLVHQSGGTWKYVILHDFFNINEGASPNGPLVFDKAGNIYGTTQYGGIGSCPEGCGVVFKLSPQKKGKWKYTVLHRFTGGSDGGTPWAGLAIDAKGRLYGTTSYGGAHYGGVVFEITP